LGWIRVLKYGVWNDSIDDTHALTEAGFSDWRVGNIKEKLSLFDYGNNNRMMNYSPFNETNTSVHSTNTTLDATSTSSYTVNNINGSISSWAKTSNAFYLICRNHYT
jgi:hypothetical protein